MMATVPHVISGLGLRKFQANGFLLTRVYIVYLAFNRCYPMKHIYTQGGGGGPQRRYREMSLISKATTVSNTQRLQPQPLGPSP